MTFRCRVAFLMAIVLTTLPGCPRAAPPGKDAATSGLGDADAKPVTFPDLGASRTIKPGILFQEATIQRGLPMRVWVYQPEKAAGKLPLMLVPPAGSTLIAGMDLGDGDRAEHYPYAKAGFIVVSFEIDGHVPNNAPDSAILKGARQFKAARAGLANAKVALDFALAKVPNIDAKRIFIAGHSSAATLALLFAEHEPRIKGCAAFAPVTDVEDRIGNVAASLDSSIPGYRDFLRFSSPRTHVDKLKCPVFLFYAKDDTTVPPRQTTDFAETLKKTNAAVTLVSVARGGHYDSMLREGIPKAIQWFQKLP
jgi:dipeptidyl aminopeptidase/acylaminoacyl peptidase